MNFYCNTFYLFETDLWVDSDSKNIFFGAGKTDLQIGSDGTYGNITARDGLNINSPFVNISGGLNVDKNSTFEYIDYKTKLIKYHKDGTINTLVASAWQNVTWNISVPTESTSGYNLTSDNVTFDVSFDGIISIQGCVHFKNNKGSSLDTRVGVRALVDGIESRCVQRSDQFVKDDGEYDAMNYMGTANVTSGSTIQIQYYVGDVGVDLEGDTIFDSPIAASVYLTKLTDLG